MMRAEAPAAFEGRFSMGERRLAAVVVLVALYCGPNAQAQGPQPPLIGEVVSTARVVALLPSGTLAISLDGLAAELRLADIALPSAESDARKRADELVRNRLVGRSVHVHLRGSPEDETWAGFTTDDGNDARLELVRRGLARYCPGGRREGALVRGEERARAGGGGIWAAGQEAYLPRCERPAN